MRTDTAKITAVLLASKKRPDGTCPVAVRVNWKGRAISTLPVSVTEKDWDAKNACVRKSVKNAANMNSIISQALAEADARRLEYEREGRSYTAAERGGYVWPIFRSGMTEDQRSYAMTRVSNTSCKRLKGLAGRLGIQGNVTPYVARHTYATMAAKSGVANAVLARSMGRTVGGIDGYVHSLTSAEALLEAKRMMR